MSEQPVKKKVLNIQSRICIGGPAIQIELLAKHLDRNKFEPIFLGGAIEKDESSRLEDISNLGVKIDIIKSMHRRSHPLNDLLSVFQVYRYIKKEKPDIVHTHTAKAGAVGRVAAFLARTPVVIHTFHGHSFANYFSRLTTAVFIHIERLLSRITTRIIAISTLQKEDLTSIYKIAAADKVEIINIGIDVNFFAQHSKSHNLRETLGLADTDKLIGTVGRLVPIKNIELLIKSFAVIREQNQNVHLCIGGDGPERENLQQLVSELGLNDCIHFLGWVHDVKEFYAGIDVYAISSLNEGTPVTILEAMASRVPVVATAVGGVPDLIRNRENGLLCDSNNVDGMARAIGTVFENADLAKKLCDSAFEFVRQNYSQEKFISMTEELYLRLCRMAHRA